MAKTSGSAAVRAEVERRPAALTPEHARRWGVAPVGGMLCHLDDSDGAVTGEPSLSAASVNVPHWLGKLVGLRQALHRRATLPTGERLRQRAGGTLIPGHRFFGGRTRGRWMRRGYRHADHHLRRFSA